MPSWRQLGCFNFSFSVMYSSNVTGYSNRAWTSLKLKGPNQRVDYSQGHGFHLRCRSFRGALWYHRQTRGCRPVLYYPFDFGNDGTKARLFTHSIIESSTISFPSFFFPPADSHDHVKPTARWWQRLMAARRGACSLAYLAADRVRVFRSTVLYRVLSSWWEVGRSRKDVWGRSWGVGS